MDSGVWRPSWLRAKALVRLTTMAMYFELAALPYTSMAKLVIVSALQVLSSNLRRLIATVMGHRSALLKLDALLIDGNNVRTSTEQRIPPVFISSISCIFHDYDMRRTQRIPDFENPIAVGRCFPQICLESVARFSLPTAIARSPPTSE
ncbi:hypothetical protein ARMSODRAFT_1017486 [Armillaria solidipes]|uniref:Uncharacterized protein n=1 Tax=Armillaria solidipes TaxID=1076256 RepID=A0A2H3C5V8_9AGAR|nr:hypothetical protein ARMSODRAFT_1017486 [Armillaria solidipes]